MLEKLKNLLLYAGAEPEDFARCQMDVQIANRRRLTAFLGTACAFFVALTLGSCMVPLLYDHIPVFAVALIVSLGLLAVEQMLPQKLGLFLHWEIYAFGAMVYGLGIFLGTVQTPDQRATAFFAFLLCVPMLFMMRPILHIANVLLFDGIFLVCVTRFKDWRVIPMDVCNALVFGAISCIVSTFVMSMMYGNFITSSKLTTVAESDLNTRLHNRNAYENRLRDYPLRCSNSLTCVYIDVNGLHELNNTYGHEEGDKMLRTVACILREIFGEEDSYRIGGDEFVAFALDSTDTELNENMEQFVRQVEEAGIPWPWAPPPTARAALTLTLSSKRRSSGCIWTKADITNSCGAAPKNEHSAGKTPTGAVLFCALIFLFPVVRGTIYCN